MKICVVGLGYVGLPLAIQFARSNVTVIGLDTDESKVDLIQKGQSYIKHIASETIARLIKTKSLSASTDFHNVREAEAVIICVPSPLNKNREPDISYILETGKMIAPHLSKGTLVALESTTYPATTDEDLRQVIEKGSGMQAGVDFHLAFSPEREDPGNPNSVVASIPKIAGTRAKIAFGFSRGCPIVSTSLGAYGYEVQNEQEILLADSADNFADACLKVLQLPNEAAKMAERAKKKFLENWTWEAIQPRIWAAAEDCLRRSANTSSQITRS
jgi:hypothetical protein